MAAPLIRSRSNAVVRRFRASKERASADWAFLEGTKLLGEALAAGASIIEVAARESGILTHADQSAAKVLTELLGRDGYRVEIVRPVVEHRPTG